MKKYFPVLTSLLLSSYPLLGMKKEKFPTTITMVKKKQKKPNNYEYAADKLVCSCCTATMITAALCCAQGNLCSIPLCMIGCTVCASRYLWKTFPHDKQQ